REMLLSEEYSKIRNLLFFLATPYEWLFYYLILILGVSTAFERWASSTSKYFIAQVAVYLFWLSLASFIVLYPLSYISYAVSKAYHISTLTFSAWMKDKFIDFWVDYGIMLLVVSVLYILIRR